MMLSFGCIRTSFFYGIRGGGEGDGLIDCSGSGFGAGGVKDICLVSVLVGFLPAVRLKVWACWGIALKLSELGFGVGIVPDFIALLASAVSSFLLFFSLTPCPSASRSTRSMFSFKL